MNHKPLSIFLTLALAAISHAVSVLAVLEITSSDDVRELTIDEHRLLSDELRRQVVGILPASDFTILTRDGIISLLPPDEKEAECLAESCTVEIGRAIGAEYIASGRVSKFAGKLSLTVELYETMNGKLLGSFLTYGTDVTGLMETIKTESPAMFKKIPAKLSEPLSEPEYPEFKEFTESGKSLNQVNQGSDNGKEGKGGIKPSTWAAIGLDVLGAAAICFGIYQDSQVGKHKKAYDKVPLGSPDSDFDKAYNKVEDARGRRNIGYIAGGALLAAGISIHIFF